MMTISAAILDMIDWLDREDNSGEYAKGIVTGLKIAQQIAEIMEAQNGN